MPKIEWKGIIENPADYQMGFLSKNAKKLNMPKTLNEMMIKDNICGTGSDSSCYRNFGVYFQHLSITGTRIPSCNCISSKIYCGYRFCSKTVCSSRIGFLSAQTRQVYFDVFTSISAWNYTNHFILHIYTDSYRNERFPFWIIYNGTNKPICG